MSGVDVSGGATTDPAGPDDRTDGPDRSRFAWRTDAWCLVLIAVVLLLPVPGLMRYQGPPMEEGFMLVFPEQMLNGSLPHRDFLHLYGPGSLWALAAVFKVFGTDLFVERMVGLAQHAAVAYGMYALLRPWGRRIATSGAIVSVVILIGPLGLSAMAWNGALALGVCSLAVGAAAVRRAGAGDEGRRWLVPLAGVLGGAALLYRPDLVLAVALGLGALWFELPRPRRRPLLWRRGGRPRCCTSPTCCCPGSAIRSGACSWSRSSTSGAGGRCPSHRPGARSTGSCSGPARCG